MSAYFIRQSQSPQQDIERSFSAVGSLVLGSDERAALSYLAELEGVDFYAFEDEEAAFERWADDNAHRVGFHSELGGYVQKRRGLCFHASFETLEAARTAWAGGEVLLVADAGAEGDFYVFEGREVWEDSSLSQDDGGVFAPTGAYWKL